MAEAPARTRHGFVDALRGYVILLVVVCHVSGGVRNAGIPVSAWVLSISDYSYSFFMPLMFLLSGLFIESAVRRGTREYAVGRLRTLVYPFVLWTLLDGGIALLAAPVANHAVGGNPLSWLLWAPVGPLWFIQALIVCQALYGALRFLGLRPGPVAAIGIATTLAAPLLPDGVLAGCANAFGFFAVGSAVSGALLDRLPKAPLPALLAVAAAFEAVHVGALRAGWPALLTPFVAVCGLAAPLCVGVAFGNRSGFAPLRTLGEASLAIFVLHTVVAAGLRAFLQRALHLSAPWPHLVLGIGAGLIVPVLLWNLSLGRLPWLFRLPARRLPVAETVGA